MTRCPGTISLRCQEMALAFSGWFLAVSPAFQQLGNCAVMVSLRQQQSVLLPVGSRIEVSDCCSLHDVLGIFERVGHHLVFWASWPVPVPCLLNHLPTVSAETVSTLRASTRMILFKRVFPALTECPAQCSVSNCGVDT